MPTSINFIITKFLFQLSKLNILVLYESHLFSMLINTNLIILMILRQII